MLLRAFSILLLALFSGPLLAAPADKLSAAEERWKIHCQQRFEALEASVAGRKAAEKPVYDREARIRRRHATFDQITTENNSAFIKMAKLANAGMETIAKLYFDLENAVLKELNDRIVLDKELVTALTNLHKELVWNAISADPLLSKHMVGNYSDFKSIRIAFDEDNPALKKRLRELIPDINKKYSDYVGKLAEEKGWDVRTRGLSADRRNWYQAGFGKTPDQAGLASRCARALPGPGGVSVPRSFTDCLARLESAAKNVGRYLQWAGKRFGAVPGMMVDAENGRLVPSAELIEAIKKAKPAAATRESMAEAVNEELRRRFKVELSAKESEALRQALELADQFSPGLLQAERVVIDMGQEAKAALSADFKGQNARNLEETFRALARTEGMSMADRVREVRRGEEAATARLEEMKARYQKVVGRMFPGMQAQYTGDDGIAFLPKDLSLDERLRFARYWKEEGGGAGDLRLTHEPFRYADTGAVIPPEKRSAIVSAAEEVEKEMRRKLLQRGFNRVRLNRLQVMVNLEARASGAARVGLELLGGGSFTPAELEKVKELLREMGHEAGHLEVVP